jgi:hypothetical protein
MGQRYRVTLGVARLAQRGLRLVGNGSGGTGARRLFILRAIFEGGCRKSRRHAGMAIAAIGESWKSGEPVDDDTATMHGLSANIYTRMVREGVCVRVLVK